MTTQVTATFVNCVLSPDEALPLPEQSRVRITIEPIEGWSHEGAIAAWEALKAQIREQPVHLGGKRHTRDKLHERH